MNGAGDLGTLVIRLTSNTTGFDSGMLTAIGRFAMLGAAATAAATAFAAFATSTAKAQIAFEGAMTKSLAIMEDMSVSTRKQMEETALVMSTKSTSSATDLAKSYYYLASAGLDAERSMRALHIVQEMSVAGDMNLEKATEALTDSVTNLGLASKDAAKYQLNMARVSDVLVKAGAESNASTEQLAVSLRTKAGAALRTFHKDVEEGVAVLAAFGDQGIKAENAGEALNIVMRDLARSSLVNAEEWRRMGLTVFDGSGKMRNMADIIEDLENRLGAYTDEGKKAALMTLGFQDRTVSTTNALLSMSDKIREYEATFRSATGFAGTVAQKQLESTETQLKVLGNTFDTLKIRIGQDFNPELRGTVAVLKDITTEAQRGQGILHDLGAAVGVVGEFFTKLGIAIKFGAESALSVIRYLGVGLTKQLTMSLTRSVDIVVFLRARVAEPLQLMFESMWLYIKRTFMEGVLWVKQQLNELDKAVAAASPKLAKALGFGGKGVLDTDKTQKSIDELNDQLAGLESKSLARVASIQKWGDGLKAPVQKWVDAMDSYQTELGSNVLKSLGTALSLWSKFNTTVAAARNNRVGNASTPAAVLGLNAAAVQLAMDSAEAMKRERIALENLTIARGKAYTEAAGMLDSPWQAVEGNVRKLTAAYAENAKQITALENARKAGKITELQYQAGLKNTTFTQEQFNAALLRTSHIAETRDPYEAQLDNLDKLNQLMKDNASVQAMLDAQVSDGTLTIQQRDMALSKLLLTQDAYGKAASRAVSSGNEFVGAHVLETDKTGAFKYGPSVQGAPSLGLQDPSLTQPSVIQDQAAMNALVAQEEQLKESYERQIEIVKKAEEEKRLTREQSIQMQTQMEQNYARKKEVFEQQQMNMQMDAATSTADSLTEIALSLAGRQSSIYKTMFAVSKAFAIASSMVKISQGIAEAAANPFPYNLAAMASVAAATSSIVSNIMAVRMTSFEGGGMTESGARTGGIDGRGGMLSVLHPDEMVVDLKAPKNRGPALGDSGEIKVIVNNYAAADTKVETRSSMDGKQLELIITKTKESLASDINTGKGAVPAALNRSFGLSRGK